MAFCGTLAVAMSDRDGGSSAWRRRQRRLRSMLRHERQTVPMELAAALHHSRDVGLGTNDGLRAQTTASSGKRPGVLTEPESQGGAVTVGYVAAPVPTLALSVLAASAGEAVDDRSLRFLLGRSLAEKKEEEEKRRKEKVEEFCQASLARARELYGSKRKRKKRRKRPLPRSPRPLLRGRAHRRQWLWHVRAPRAVFPSFGGRPRCLVFWWPRSSLTPPAAYARLVLLVFHFALCSILSFSGPRCSTPWSVWTRGTIMCLAGFTGDDIPRAAFLRCLCAQGVWHFGRHGPAGQLRRRGQGLRLAFLGLVLEFTAECVHGAGVKDCALALLGLVLVFMSVAVHLQGRLHPVVAQRLFPWLRLFSRPSRFSWYSTLTRFDVFVVHDQQVPRVQAWRRQPSPTLHSFSGADVEKTVEIPQLQLVEAGLRACPAGSTGAVVEKTVEIPQLQPVDAWPRLCRSAGSTGAVCDETVEIPLLLLVHAGVAVH